MAYINMMLSYGRALTEEKHSIIAAWVNIAKPSKKPKNIKSRRKPNNDH